MNDVFGNYTLRFQGAVPGSPADKAGMKIGDLIISVNGIPTPDHNAYIEAIADRGTTQKMDIIRNGQLIEMTLELPTKSLVQDETDCEAIVKKFQEAGLLPKE